MAVQFLQHDLLKRPPFSIVFLPFFPDFNSIGVWVYFCEIYFVPLICVAVFVSVLSCFDSRSFVVQSEIKRHDSSCSVLFLFKIALTIQAVWCLHIQFRIICSHSEKNVMNILIRIA